MAAPQGMIRGVIIKLPHTRDVTRKIVYLMRNRKDPEIDTEPTIELLCIVVAGNAVSVCHHVD